MVEQLLLSLFVLVSVFIGISNGQCVPRDVQNLVLLPSGILTWIRSPEEICFITYFHIRIYRGDEEVYNVKVEETSIDVSFLASCQAWTFNVVSVSQDASSPGQSLTASLPGDSGGEVSLSELEVVRTNNDLRLQWKVNGDTYSSCVDRFRVTVADKDRGSLVDYYVDDNFLDLDLSPCVAYEFIVRAIYSHKPSQEGPMISIEYDNPPVTQQPPRLATVDVGATNVNMTWILESRDTNRCPLGRIFVDGGIYFSFSVPLVDAPVRQPVTVRLNSLRANSMYLVRVSIENNAGLSNASMVGVQTLQLIPNMK